MCTVDECFNFILEKIKESKALEMEYITPILKEKYGEKYSSEIGIAVKEKLRHDENIDFFKEGNHINDNKFYFSSGNWVAIKGKFQSAVQMKRTLGIEMWESKV